MVLGVQWLVTLGPILWNFKELTMIFTWRNKEVTQKGSKDAQLLMMNKKQSCKVHGYTMVLTGQIHGGLPTTSALQASQSKWPLDLQQLLASYTMIFEVPTKLPPKRSHDHKIPFIDESKAVRI